jgi:hypothetical protein
MERANNTFVDRAKEAIGPGKLDASLKTRW